MNAEELEMESTITDGQIHNEEDDKNNKITSVQETGNVKPNREDLEAQRNLRTVNDQEKVIEPRVEDNAADITRNEDDHSKVNNPGQDNGTRKKKDKENDDKNTEDGENKKIDPDGAETRKNSREQTDEKALESQNHQGDKETDEDTDKCEGGSLRRFGENVDLTKSQDGIDEDYTYQPGLHSSLHKWSDMSNLQEGIGSGLNDYNQQDFESISPIDLTDTFSEFQSSGGIFSPTMAHHRDLTLDQGSSVDYPEHSPESTRQSNSPDMFYPGNANNTRNQQILETIPENDSDEPDEQNKGKEDEKVILLKKGNIKKLLRHLLETNVLTEGEFKRCETKPKREDMCTEMMKIVQRKTGGELLLKQALKEVKVEDGSPRKVKVPSKVLVEKEREISKLKAKISHLQKELATKSDEIKDLKKVKPINVVEPLIKTRDHNMIHTITERRRASRELEAQPNIPAVAGEATQQLQQELEHLKHELMIKDKEMEAVQNLKDTYPYITDVLGCPSFPIKLPGYDSTVPIYCPVMKFSSTNANPNACQILDEVVLINEPSPNRTSGNRKYQGTSGSTPFLLPVIVSKILPHPVHYWEAHTVVSLECMILSFHTLFEIGVCEESFVDRMSWLHKSPRSWSIRIGICRKHHWGVCAQVYGSAAKHGLCFTHVMSNIPEKTSTLCYGIVLDVGTGKVGLIDIGKERLLHTFNVEFRENLYPMFGVQPLADVCSINMALMSGDQVEMTERKERLIIKALSS